mmetsp:Transcript_25743/g.36884  ORF Transcript_25743/g.36884 Transcript_25743/m.36884 type:complete len:631 (-) Transcript_25743:311-2203(-)
MSHSEKSLHECLLEKSKEWVNHDPNPITRGLVQSFLVSSSMESLEKYFGASGRIAFGTAGLRGPMVPGPHGLNDLVVIQATQGIARCCQEQQQQQGPMMSNKAVIGYDHRCNPDLGIDSYTLACYATVVLQESGFDVLLLTTNSPETLFVPTPLVAFATLALQCSVGIMITASHNPKQDNGYKVFWSDGCQIRSPIDIGISQKISQELIPWRNDYFSLVQTLKSRNLSDDIQRTTEMTNQYFTAMKSTGLYTGIGCRIVSAATSSTSPTVHNPIKIAYTAMHGVGAHWVQRAFHTFHLPPLIIVPAQEIPNPAFPTVSFPNPEETGALSLAMEYAEEHGCSIVLANDPDADRLAVAEYNGDSWVIFTGDQIGILLGHYLYTVFKKQDPAAKIAMCASTVSSSMLGAIAKAEKFTFVDTLTGFKHIGAQSQLLRSQGYRVVFSYEEALGYCCGEFLCDKDGVTAAVVMGELVNSLWMERNNMTLRDYLQSLYDTYGEFVSSNGYYLCNDPTIVAQVLDRVRQGGNYTKMVAGYPISSIRDLGVPGYDSTQVDGRPKLPTSASSPLMTMHFENGCVFQMRPSGTEPKFKYYFELNGAVGLRREVVLSQLEEMKAAILEELFQPSRNGLVGKA